MADGYVMRDAQRELESERLRNLQAAGDAFTHRRLEAAGVEAGWRCLEVGAGGGSIARWLDERVGATGKVVATDVDLGRLEGLPDSIDVRRHDIIGDELEAGAYDLVHCRFVIQHLTDSAAALSRMTAALAPGGRLVAEEADFGLVQLSGAPESARATRVLQDVMTRFTAAGVMDGYLGRRLPGLVADQGLDELSVEISTPVGQPGDPAFETVRLAWPTTRAAAGASGIADDDLRAVDDALDSSTLLVGVTTFAVSGRAAQ